uniref:CCHC-type domain-containing protein n=1 Tax=Panagrolaimus davidi TaxID=227884 RepID=A0A914QIF9_9BILA
MAHENLNSFVERFEKLAEQATAGLSDEVKAQKLLDEFLLKLDPELAFLVRQTEPDTYTKALDVARKNEVFLKLKNIDTAKARIAPIQTSLSFENLDIDELARQVAENLRTDEGDSETNFEDQRDCYDDDQFDHNFDDEHRDNRQSYDNSNAHYDSRVCCYCGTPGHLVRNCHQRILQEEHEEDLEDEFEDQSGFDEDQFGYNDGQDDEQNYGNSDVPFDNRICYYCGKQGHVLRYCYQRKMQEEEDNMQQGYDDYHQVNAVNTRSTREEILKLKLQNESLKRQNRDLALFGKPF